MTDNDQGNMRKVRSAILQFGHKAPNEHSDCHISSPAIEGTKNWRDFVVCLLRSGLNLGPALCY